MAALARDLGNFLGRREQAAEEWRGSGGLRSEEVRAAQEQAASPVVAKMLEHQHAVDMLYQGLVVPSNEMWKQGAEALKASPLKADAFPVDAQLSKEALDAQARTHEVAEKAAAAATPTARAEVYGDLIGGCASCHSISGRVLGPGVPK